MPVWKQIATVLVIATVALGAWLQLSPDAAPARPDAGLERGAGEAARAGRGGGFRGPGGRGPALVVMAEVVEAEAGSRLDAIGTARASRSVTLYSQTTGIASEIAFTAGQQVAAGDVLIRIDDAGEAIAVEQARIALKTAEDTVTRYDRLTRTQAISAVQAEEARSTLARARTDLAAAELALERRTVRAPFAGVMGLSEVDVGDMLTGTTIVANIDDRASLLVEFNVPERFAALVQQGTAISATTAAYAGERFDGEVSALDSRVDPTSRTMKVRATISNEDDRLRPGMAFSVAVAFDTPGRPAVPEIAVQWDRDGAYVWKVVDGKAQRTAVRIVARTPQLVLVDGDISTTDTVIAEGLEGLRDGAEIAEAGETPADAASL